MVSEWAPPLAEHAVIATLSYLVANQVWEGKGGGGMGGREGGRCTDMYGCWMAGYLLLIIERLPFSPVSFPPAPPLIIHRRPVHPSTPPSPSISITPHAHCPSKPRRSYTSLR